MVDPIDGTVNFLYGLPAYAVSIAAEVDGEVVRRGRAQRGDRGAVHGHRGAAAPTSSSPARPEPVRLAGSRPASLEQTLVATGFGYRVEQRRAQGAVVAALLPQVRDIRRLRQLPPSTSARRPPAGSTPTTSCDLNPWDHAAGALVAAEAGLVVTGLPGSPFAEPMAIAAAPSIAGAVHRPARRTAHRLTAGLRADGPQQDGGRAVGGRERRRDLLRRGQGGEVGADDHVDGRVGAGVGVVAGARQEQAHEVGGVRCPADRAGARRRRSPCGRWCRWRSRRR